MIETPRTLEGSRSLVVQGGFARIGGIEVFARNLVRLLREADSEVDFAYWARGEEGPLAHEIRGLGARMLRGPISRGQRWDLPDRALSFRAAAAARAADRIVFLKPMPDAALRRILDAAPRARAIHVPAFCPEEDETWRFRPRPDPNLLARLDLVIAQCPRMASQFRSFFGYRGRIEILPYLPGRPATGPGAARRADLPALPSGGGVRGPIRIGCMGRLVAQKRPGDLLEAFALATRTPTDPPLELHFHGDGGLEGPLRARAAELGVASRVFFHGAYRPEDVAKVVASCHLFAQTSRSEGQCLAAIEVGMGGRPLVAVSAGCVGDVLRDPRCGSVGEYESPERFADRLLDAVVGFMEGRFDAGEIALIQRERFAPEVVEEGFLRLLAEPSPR